MNYLVKILLVTVLFGASARALFVEAPEKITLLPQNASIVFHAVYYTPLISTPDEFPAMNPLNKALKAVEAHRGENFHKCYNLNEVQVATYVAALTGFQLFEKFQKDINDCSEESTLEYQFNCYVKVIQSNLQDIFDYAQTTHEPLEWELDQLVDSEELSEIDDDKQTVCVADELKELMESAQRIIDAYRKYFGN